MYRHAAEDSATAEISRSQIWQWVRHGLRTEDGQQVTLELVYALMHETAAALWAEGRAQRGLDEGALKVLNVMWFDISGSGEASGVLQ